MNSDTTYSSKSCDIIERLYGYSDKEMYYWCVSLKNVMDKKIILKLGRGKHIKEYEKFKYNGTEEDKIRERINTSIKHYGGL